MYISCVRSPARKEPTIHPLAAIIRIAAAKSAPGKRNTTGQEDGDWSRKKVKTKESKENERKPYVGRAASYQVPYITMMSVCRPG